MVGINRRAGAKATSSGKGKPPVSAPKEREELPPSTSPRLSFDDMIAIAREATVFMREAAGYLSEREKTRQAVIQSQHELERISADLEKERMTHQGNMRRLDQDDKVVETVLAQLTDLRECIRPFLADLANLDHHRVQTLMALLDKITTLQGNLLEQCRR